MAFLDRLPATINAETSAAYGRQKDEWKMVNDLMAGTRTMRLNGTNYLPQHENESDPQYGKRLAVAVLTPFFKRAINFSTGKAFYKELVVVSADDDENNKKELSDKMQMIVEDANKKNDSLNKFANFAFKDSMAKGLGYLYVDAPVLDPEKVYTEAEMKSLNVRPYLLYIAPEDVLDVEIDENGVIIYCKLFERYTEFNKDKLVTVEKTRIRVVTDDFIGS